VPTLIVSQRPNAAVSLLLRQSPFDLQRVAIAGPGSPYPGRFSKLVRFSKGCKSQLAVGIEIIGSSMHFNNPKGFGV